MSVYVLKSIAHVMHYEMLYAIMHTVFPILNQYLPHGKSLAT